MRARKRIADRMSVMSAALLLGIALAGCGSSPAATSSGADETADSAGVADIDSETAPADESAEPTDSAPAGEPRGTRQDPYRVGTEFEVGDWIVVFNSFNLDANDIVAAADDFGVHPPTGFTFIIANYTVTYTGDDIGRPWMSFHYIDAAHSSDNTDVPSISASVRLDSEIRAVEVQTGDSATGDRVLLIPVDPAEHAVFAVLVEKEDPVFVAFQ